MPPSSPVPPDATTTDIAHASAGRSGPTRVGDATTAPLQETRWQHLLRTSSSVVVFATVAIASIVGATIAALVLLRDFAVQEKKRELAALSLMLAEDTGQKLFSARLVLDVLAEYARRPQHTDQRSYREYLSTADAHRMLVDKVGGNPIIDVATFVADNGDVMNFTRSFPPPKINLADRDYFRAQSTDRSVEVYYSLPVQNRGNGKWVFYMTRRIESPDGRFLGLVLVGVSVEVFSDYYRRVAEGMGPGSSITLYRNDFRLMTRWPLRDELVGKTNANSATALVIRDQRKTSDVVLFAQPRLTEGNESQARMVAPRMVDQFPFIVTPVVTEQAYLAKWRTFATWLGLIAAISILLVTMGAFRMWTAFRRLDSTLRLTEELRGKAEVTAGRLKVSEERQRQAADAVIKLNASLERRVEERTQALRLANQELESYSYSVAHDLRSPLRLIVGFSQILRMRYGDRLDADFRRMQEDISRAGKNMGELIDGLLAMARVGQANIERIPIDISALAEQVFADIPAPMAGTRATTRIQPGMDARADPTLARAVLFNLISNAVKYSSQVDQPAIECGAEEVDGQRRFFVRDNGVGFDSASAQKLFQPFQRLHAGPQFPGTGIGLATTRKIIERHGGRLWAESMPGAGATFYFTFG